jgi:hypothetical protein
MKAHVSQTEETDMSEKKVDQEWKQRAREEKERLSREQPSSGKGAAPEPSFALIVSSFVAQALIALGEMQSPVDGAKKQDLEAAKFSIDLLQVLSDKTKGSLTEEERKMLDSSLYDLRMRYVQVSS